MEMWLCTSLSAFSSCQANKVEGREGEWQHKQWNSLEIQSWKDVLTDERQQEEAAQFLLCCTREESLGQAKSVP